VGTSWPRTWVLRCLAPDVGPNAFQDVAHCATFSDWLVLRLVLRNLDEEERHAVVTSISDGLKGRATADGDECGHEDSALGLNSSRQAFAQGGRRSNV